MLSDDQIVEIGTFLEDQGLSHAEINTYFEHHGVKGMKWGVHNESTSVNRSGTKSYGRQGRTNGETQTRAARNMKRAAAFIAGGVAAPGFGAIPALVAYNSVAKPVAGGKQKAQSGKAFVAKMAVVGVLGTPLAMIPYYQMARPVRAKKAPKSDFTKRVHAEQQARAVRIDKRTAQVAKSRKKLSP